METLRAWRRDVSNRWLEISVGKRVAIVYAILYGIYVTAV